MAVGWLSLGFSAVCAVGLLIGSAFPHDEPKKAEVNYLSIYKRMIPEELEAVR